jgi:hypothetical protein
MSTTGATSGAGTAYPSGALEFTPRFSGVRVTRSLVLYVCFVDRCLSFCTFSFGIVECGVPEYYYWHTRRIRQNIIPTPLFEQQM